MRSNFYGVNIPILLLSLCMAVVAWYTITVKERTDMQLDVRLEYVNIPDNLIITEGLIHKVSVHLRGPKTLLAGHDTRKPYLIDLSDITKGKNIIPFIQPQFEEGTFRAFEVLDITPPQMIVFTDTLLERNVPIKEKLATSFHSSAFKVQDIHISPSTALIRGPEQTITKIKSIPLELQVDAKEQPGTYTKKFPLVASEVQTSITPALVSVTYTVASQRTSLKLNPKVAISGDPNSYTLSPQSLSLEVEVPEGLAKNTSYLKGLVVRVTPPLLETGQSAKVKATLTLPEGMTLLKTPEQVFTITRLDESTKIQSH